MKGIIGSTSLRPNVDSDVVPSICVTTYCLYNPRRNAYTIHDVMTM